jgi:hypothetical protein
MNQSTFLGGALLAGFILYLAAKNRLSAYGAVFSGGKTAVETEPTANGVTKKQMQDAAMVPFGAVI